MQIDTRKVSDAAEEVRNFLTANPRTFTILILLSFTWMTYRSLFDGLNIAVVWMSMALFPFLYLEVREDFIAWRESRRIDKEWESLSNGDHG